MSNSIQILIIEDNYQDVLLIERYLDKTTSSKFEVAWESSLQSALIHLKERNFDVILLDLFLPDSEGFSTFNILQESVPETAIVILSGVNDVKLAINAVSQGAQYYLVKGPQIGQILEEVILYAIKRKNYEHEAIEYAKAQERLVMFKRFVEDITHDIRTPFTTITNHLYILRTLLPDADAKVEKSIKNIDKNVQRLHRIMEDMITLTTLEAEITIEQKEIFGIDLGELINQILNAFDPLAKEKNIEVIYEKPLDPIWVWGSQRQLILAFKHIITNSVTYTPHGGQITIELSETRGLISAEISDTGIGIPAEDLPYIFDHFYRGDKARSSNDVGSGLGLPIAKRIIQLHNGSILVESKVDEGSIVRIGFPSLTPEDIIQLQLLDV